MPSKADLGAPGQIGWDAPLVDQSVIIRTTTPTGYTGPADQRKCDMVNMPADTILLRNGSADIAPTQTSSLTEEASPAALDWILGEDAAGNLRKYDVGNLPLGAGGEVNTASNIGTQGFGVYDGKVGAELQFRHVESLTTGTLVVTFDAGANEIGFTVVDSGLVLAASQITSGTLVYAMGAGKEQIPT